MTGRALLLVDCQTSFLKEAPEPVLARLDRLLRFATMVEMPVVATLERPVAAKGDREIFGREDVAFHVAIAKASHNPLYATILSALEKRCIDYTQANRAEGDWYDRVLETHTGIVKAIREGDADEAASSMRHHLILSRRHYIDIGEGDGDGE